jgi:L-alanine-DL-glutamate epimerase-like enolase superfamily enzyme
MQIESVEAHPVSIPLVDLEDGGIAPYVTNHTELTNVERVLVEVRTDEGINGWGEMRVFLSPATTVSIIEEGIGPLVIGRSPFETEAFRRQLFIEYTNVDLFFAAIEIACWDIVGKVLDRPVNKLLGGWTAPAAESRSRDPNNRAQEEVALAYCMGILSPSEARSKAADVLANGYDVLKVKGGRNWREDVERVKAMHKEVDGELEFRLDPNQGWTVDEAIRVAGSLDDEGIYLQYLEQPIRVDSHESLATLRQRTYQPIGPNEDTYILHNLRRLIERGAMDIAVVDMTPAGGITALRQLAAIAEDAGIPATHHCAFDLGIRTAAILHAVSGIPGFSLPIDTAYYAWQEDVINKPLEIDSGAMAVPDDPGLGVTIDRDTVEHYRIKT